MRTRAAALDALFSRISAAYAWKNTPSRRLVLWNDCPKEQRPAFYQFEGGKDAYKWTSSPVADRTIEVKLFFYFDSSDTTVAGSVTLAAVKDAIDAALAADAGAAKCTLGGACDWARIDGDIISDPGDLDGDGLLVLPVKITLP